MSDMSRAEAISELEREYCADTVKMRKAKELEGAFKRFWKARITNAHVIIVNILKKKDGHIVRFTNVHTEIQNVVTMKSEKARIRHEPIRIVSDVCQGIPHNNYI